MKIADPDEVVRMVLDGVSNNDIAKHFGVTSSAIPPILKRTTGLTARQLRREAGWSRSQLPPWVEAEVRAFALAHRDWSRCRIAKHFGCGPAYVRTALQDVDRPRPRLRDRGDFVDQIVARYLAGATTTQIARENGLHERSVRRVLDSRQVERRPRGTPSRA